MSFAGMLGAGLLGGVGNAAQGIGNRLREEAKAKRVAALQESANAQAEKVAKTANDNAVDAARERRVFDAREGRLNRNQQIAAQNNQGSINAANTEASQNNQGAINAANTEASQNNQGAINAANTEASQNNQGSINAANTEAAQNNQGAINAANTEASQNNQGSINAANTEAAQNNQGLINAAQQDDQQAFTAGLNTANNAAALARIHAADVGKVESFYNEDGLVYKAEKQADGSWKAIGSAKAPDATTKNAITLQTSYDTDGREIRGYMNDKAWVTVGSPKAASKADDKPLTDAQLQSHMTAQVWKHVGGKVDKYGEQLPLSPEDSKLAARWNKSGSAKIQKLKDAGIPITPAVVASVIAETFVRPFDVTKIKLTQDDRAKANQRYDDEASSMESDSSQFGMSESQIKRQWATENAVRRQPDFASAQKAWDENVVGPKVTQAMVDEGRRRIKALLADKGYDPSLIVE